MSEQMIPARPVKSNVKEEWSRPKVTELMTITKGTKHNIGSGSDGGALGYNGSGDRGVEIS